MHFFEQKGDQSIVIFTISPEEMEDKSRVDKMEPMIWFRYSNKLELPRWCIDYDQTYKKHYTPSLISYI